MKQNFLDKINNQKINDKDMAKLCQQFYKLDANGKRIHADAKISLAIYKHRKNLKKQI